MQGRDVYLDRITTEVEEVASRVTLLKGRFAKQKVSVKLDHYWELDYVRTRFTEFKRRIQQLGGRRRPGTRQDPGKRGPRLEGFTPGCGHADGRA